MALTRTQRRIVGEIEELLRIGGYDWRVVEESYEPDARRAQLERIKLGGVKGLEQMKRDKITIHGPKNEVPISFEFKTADSMALAFSVPRGRAAPPTRCAAICHPNQL